MFDFLANIFASILVNTVLPSENVLILVDPSFDLQHCCFELYLGLLFLTLANQLHGALLQPLRRFFCIFDQSGHLGCQASAFQGLMLLSRTGSLSTLHCPNCQHRLLKALLRFWNWSSCSF